jgi:flagellar assembly protein FliH
MSSSKLFRTRVEGEKVIIGEFRADIEADIAAEKKVSQKFIDVSVQTTIEGKKMVPVQELLKIEQQIIRENQEAHQKGYDEGYQKGLKEGHLEARKVIDNFASVIKETITQREVLFNEARSKIVEMIILVSKKVTCDAARIDHEITAAIINDAIDKLVDKSKIKVKVHPDHLPLIEQQIDRFKGESTAVKEIIIEPDKRVRFGGCFIETPTGDIDARVDSQLDVIAGAIIGNEGEQ